MRVQLPAYLRRRVERTARLTKCNVSEVIASAVETSLPRLPDEVPPTVVEELAGWMLLDDEALRAIARAFLPQKQQRRFTVLLRKQEEDPEYTRTSRMGGAPAGISARFAEQSESSRPPGPKPETAHGLRTRAVSSFPITVR